MVWERKDVPANAVWSELGSGLTDDGTISIRDEIIHTLANHGHEVFVRSPTTQRCSCYKDGAFNDFHVDCPGCNGFGYAYLDTKIRSYRRPAFGTFGFTGGAVRSAFGDITSADSAWYFPHTANIAPGFVIIEVINNENGEAIVPYKMERKHAVKLSHLYREKKGRKEYWIVLTREMRLGK